MRFKAVCKCGSENYTPGDWTSHWKYGLSRNDRFLGKWPKLRAIYLFLFTKIYFVI